MKRHYLLIVDYYSCYIEVRHLESLGALSTIERVKSIFSVQGVPSEAERAVATVKRLWSRSRGYGQSRQTRI